MKRIPLPSQLHRFVGRRACALLLLGSVIGLGLFQVELCFAYALQAFLLALGIMPPEAAGGLPSWMPRSSLAAVVAFIVAIGFLRGLLGWAQVYAQSASGTEFGFLQRSRLVRWIFRGQSVSTTEAMTIYDVRINHASTLINSAQGTAVQLTSAVLLLVCLFRASAVLSAFVAAAVALLYLSTRDADRKIFESGSAQSQALAATNEKLVASIKNLLLIQIYGTQKLEEGRAQGSLSGYREHALRLYRLTGLKYALPQFAAMVLVCVITEVARGRTQMSSGALISYFYLVLRLLQALASMNITYAVIASCWPETKKLFEWWRLRAHDGLNPPEAEPLTLAARRDDAEPVGWDLRGVAFTYPEGGKPVLSGVDLKLEPGQALAITGPSGSGKSTLLSLLLGCVRPDQGSIDALLCGGRREPLESFRGELLPLIGYVGPDNFLLEGTLYDNLVYGLPRAPSSEELAAALARAECGFVSELSRGLESRLTEQGQGLSAGQKQRLALARALLRQPKVMILDEATSNLDSATEERLVETFSRLKGEMTIIAATHRQALLRIADQRMSLA